MKIKVGDAVTIISNGRVIEATVDLVGNDSFSCRKGTHRAAGHVLWGRDESGEGITWIRGWHDLESEAVRAFLVARALS